MYKNLLKPIFFKIDPEKAHTSTLSLYKSALAIPGGRFINDKLFLINKAELEKKVFGIQFKNPIGLAAGFDKNAAYIPLMAGLGFGHMEVGTVTPLPQSGNDKPRLFRLPQDFSLINRMGFNNDGVDAMLKNLQKKSTQHAREKYHIIIGGNIGKNKDTPNDEAWKDYVICFEKLFPYVDYFVVNVSSPNTPDLRQLQNKEPLNNLLLRLQEINQKNINPKPLLLKIAPDLNDDQVNDIIEIVINTKLNGIVATNTTIERKNLTTSTDTLQKIGEGGLSGKALRKKSSDFIWYLKRASENKIDIIGVGGINTAMDVKEKLNMGASLVQLYTGLIYEGPGIVKDILKKM